MRAFSTARALAVRNSSTARAGQFRSDPRRRTVDFGTYHMYGEWAKKDDLTEWGLMWIREHVAAAAARQQAGPARRIRRRKASRSSASLRTWLREIETSSALGDLLWMLGLPKSTEQPYDPDS